MPKPPDARTRTGEDALLRRRLVILACAVTVFGLLHFVDHVVRGELVTRGGLDPQWNHSGWPFHTDMNNPFIFTASLVVVSGLLLGGIVFTVRGRLWAGYWLGTSIALAALLVWVHVFGIPPGTAETPGVIVMSYGGDVRGTLALVNLCTVIALLAVLAVQAIRTRGQSGHW